MISRNPAAVRRMTVPQRDGFSLITFLGRQAIRVPPLTDSQVCLYGSTSSGTRWLMLLEEAFGQASDERRPEFARREVASDYYVAGGSPVGCLRVMAGHETDGILLRPRGTVSMPTPAETEPKLAPLRQALLDAFREHRLVTVGTSTAELPPAITPQHSFAVLGYDPTSDAVRLWNPHRNTVRPRGVPGLTTGYLTREGIFTVPPDEFARIFARVTWETDVPLSAPPGRWGP